MSFSLLPAVHSEFELEYLLLEGHCFEAYTGNPPRGLQLTLGTKHEPVVMDTIVMANLGYLQLKSSPGRWLLGLREGRSADIYDIGKKHALKIYDQFSLNTSCFWGTTRTNITPVMQFHEIFVTKIMKKLIYSYYLSKNFVKLHNSEVIFFATTKSS